jgi:hypothetical protein
MAKTKHTPGPWQLWGDEFDEEIDIIRDGQGARMDRTVATVRACREVKANAHLIAAAPDLLDALQELVPLIAAEYPYQADVWLAKSRAAIKKAK